MKQLLRLTAPTKGTTTGTFELSDPNYFYAAVSSFRLPLGCRAKLWGYTLSGTAFNATLSVSHDGTNWTEAAHWVLVDEGTLHHTYKNRPEVFLESRSVLEQFKVEWSQGSAVATSRISLLVEISDEE